MTMPDPHREPRPALAAGESKYRAVSRWTWATAIQRHLPIIVAAAAFGVILGNPQAPPLHTLTMTAAAGLMAITLQVTALFYLHRKAELTRISRLHAHLDALGEDDPLDGLPHGWTVDWRAGELVHDHARYPLRTGTGRLQALVHDNRTGRPAWVPLHRLLGRQPRRPSDFGAPELIPADRHDTEPRTLN